MARKYDHEYKVQAVKLAKEIGGAKTAKELGIPEGTIHTWLKAVRAGKLDIAEGSHTPASAMSLSEEITMLRKRVKEQDKEIRRLKEENEFWRKPVLFSLPAVGSQQKPENDFSGFENRGRQDYRKNRILLPNAWYQPTRLL
ncbi:transposase [Enterocloster sp.]|uniref:transposase n=1 Tax=Enterocloster sp. TaxID=2719315 RepID=UPI0039935530